MTERGSFPDDIPLGDAGEQLRSVAEAAYADGLELDASPLESNESDWQEQRQIVEDPYEDEIR